LSLNQVCILLAIGQATRILTPPITALNPTTSML
jgi:hypothetical protein